MSEVTSIQAIRFNGHNQEDVREFASHHGAYAITNGGTIEVNDEKGGIGCWLVAYSDGCYVWPPKKMKTFIEEAGRVVKMELD